MLARTVFLVAALLGCESAARSERPAAAPDASAPLAVPEATKAPIPPENSAPPATTTAAAPVGHAPKPPPETFVDASAPLVERAPCRVALIGDSLTDSRVGGGYVRYLERLSPKSRFVSFAKGGAMVNQMKRQLDAMLAYPDGAFTHLVVFAGVNDLYSDETAGRTREKIETDLKALYAGGKSRGLRVVAITVAPWGGFDKYYNPRRGRVTRELNAWILASPTRGDTDVAVDAYALLSCGDPERLCPRFAMAKSDGLHFGKLGHEALGEALHAAEFHKCS
jgi:lysophospholipase L1-like esterase